MCVMKKTSPYCHNLRAFNVEKNWAQKYICGEKWQLWGLQRPFTSFPISIKEFSNTRTESLDLLRYSLERSIQVFLCDTLEGGGNLKRSSPGFRPLILLPHPAKIWKCEMKEWQKVLSLKDDSLWKQTSYQRQKCCYHPFQYLTPSGM